MRLMLISRCSFEKLSSEERCFRTRSPSSSLTSVPISWEGFLLRLPNATLVFVYVANARDSLRFQGRRERDFDPFRCGPQLGAEEFALADADGIGLLRHRVDGHGCITIRYLAVR